MHKINKSDRRVSVLPDFVGGWCRQTVRAGQQTAWRATADTHRRRHHRSWGTLSPTMQRWGDRESKYIVYILYACNKKYTLHVYLIMYFTFWQI